MSFAMFIFVMRQFAMEKMAGLSHEERIYEAAKKFLLCNPGRVRNYFIGCVTFNDNEALDIEDVIDYFWRY